MKVENKWFLLPEYEKEEEYLINKAKQGYEVVTIKHKVFTVEYTFKEVESKDIIYRLDFHMGNDDQSYIQMYEDYGWTYITKLNNFYYFKKEGTSEDIEIFNDNESRYEMVKSIRTNKLLPILCIFLCSSGIYMNLVDPTTIFGIFYTLLLVLDVYVLVRCLKGFYDLEKKYGGSNHD